MHYDFSSLPSSEVYKLMTGVVVPRPIAWVSTLNAGGSVNLAPFSFFNMLGSSPAVVALSPGDRPDGTPKDTARNIAGPDGQGGGEFVVNLVSEEQAQAMNATATDFPEEMEEAALHGIELTPSTLVAVPRVAASPVSLECREVQTVLIGRNRIVLGEVLGLHIQPEFMLDAERHYVNSPALRLIGRMGGRGGYTRTQDTFEIDRVPYSRWLETREQ
ncbi:flavin reductase family protein [Deinococcus sp. KNUC1210]|uniref:flavin reductase family protein n=1 Tax=Deinococcus sp. KNUC1210 TaxID=2917691 RepID=UPI001EEF9688|nr:flavin reductase family protein [Deinococcus sp. KNUC1210]ULH14679.1 flavin reductase family protein [Deinococcus sp. KNUC1210]